MKKLSKHKKNLNLSLNARLLGFYILTTCILLINTSQSTGIEQPDNSPKKYELMHETVNSGLSSNTVYTVEEDMHGFLWIGTENGLNRFDSREWDYFYFNPGNPAGLSNSKIQAILSDQLGRLWVGTARGLNILSSTTNTFEQIPSGNEKGEIAGEYIRCLFEDSDKDIWVGSSEGISLIENDDSSSLDIKNIRLGSGSESENNIITIYEDRQGIIWIGTGSGLFYTRNKNDFYRFDILNTDQNQLQNAQIRSISQINDQLFIATENIGLFAYSIEEGKIRKVLLFNNGNLKELIFRDLFTDMDSVLWIASTSGVFRINSKDINFDNNDKIILNTQIVLENSVRTVFQDHNRGIWIGTQYNGLYYHYEDNFLFKSVDVDSYGKKGLNNGVVSAFLVDKDSVWIATDGGGLNLWNRRQDKFTYWTEADGLVNNNIKCLAKDWNGDLWIGTFKGLSIMRDKSFLNYNVDLFQIRDTRKPNCQFLAIQFDKKQKAAWLATEGYGLVKFDPQAKKFDFVSNQSKTFRANSVNSLLALNDSILILGTPSGFYSFNATSRAFSTYPIVIQGIGEIDPYIICTEKMNDKMIWLGTEKYGLILYDLQQQKSYISQQLDEIQGIIINAIHQTGENEIWYSTNQGLNNTRFTFRNDSLNIVNSTFYTESYGIGSKQFMARSSYMSANGELFFGSIEGLNYFSPNHIKYQPIDIPIYIKGLSYWNSRKNRIEEIQKLYSSGSEITFGPNIRDITVEFIGINYSHPENTRYAYRFSKEGEKWIESGNRNMITFNYLSNGDYSIEVKASENTGSWTDSRTILNITILPPFWKSGAAIAIYSLVILLFLYLFYRAIIRWERLQLDLKVAQLKREQEQQLHEQRIRFFTDISHELRTPLTLILSPLDMIIKNHPLSMRVMNTLRMVKQNGEKMLQLINQLLDLRKADAGHLKFRAARGNMVWFLKEVMLSFRDLADTRNISLDFQSRTEDIEGYYDRDKLEIITTNLLSNAIKHSSEGGKVRLSIEKHSESGDASISSFPDGFAQIIIEDTGKGIPSDKFDRIFDRFFDAGTDIKGSGIGLEITKKYVELHGGAILVESQVQDREQPGYTRFIIKLPLGRKHLTDEQIIDNFVGSEDIKGYMASEKNQILHPDLESEIDKIVDAENFEKQHYKIAIIEDNAELREFLVKMLGERYNITEAEDGRTGWEIIIKDLPDIIISDIMMPGMDGIELCRKIKTDVRTSHIPVILLTARTAITFKYEGLETGADEYITKPFHTDILSLKIRNLLYQREMIRRMYLKESITDPEVITVTSMDEKMLKKAINYIQEHMDHTDLSIESISEHVGISRVHFYRKIKSLTGVTPQEFLKTIRLKYAASLIVQKKLRVSEVAYMCGYKDLAYFSKSFREFHGVSPTQYSKEHLQEQ